MPIANLQRLYKVAYHRTRCEHSETTIKIAEEVREAARIIRDTATPFHDTQNMQMLNHFRETEKKWLKRPDVHTTRILADDFENAIRSNEFIGGPLVTHRRPGNGWNPTSGLVYCAVSSTRVSWIKIGATVMDLELRLKKFRYKYGYPDMSPIFSMRLTLPAEVEEEAHRRLESFRVAKRITGDSNEWFMVSAAKAIAALVEASDTLHSEIISVKTFGNRYRGIAHLPKEC